MTAITALPGRKSARRTSSGSGSATKAFNRLAATCLTLFALIWLVPFAWALITSLRPDSEITANPVSIWSNHWTLHAYTSTATTNPIGWWYLNSFIISTLSVIFTLVVCSMIGFGLAHLNFRGKSVVFAVILAGLRATTQLIQVPVHRTFVRPVNVGYRRKLLIRYHLCVCVVVVRFRRRGNDNGRGLARFC